jgi:hypothetical protein
MRLATFNRGGEERAGLVIEDTIYDIEACCSFLGLPALPPCMLAILEQDGLPSLRGLDEGLRSARRSRADLPLSC